MIDVDDMKKVNDTFGHVSGDAYLKGYMNGMIDNMGYVNLDFLGNLGHSIVRRKEDRIYIEKGNIARLGDVDYFTFEPHISLPGSHYGYKHENIYYFEQGVLKEL